MSIMGTPTFAIRWMRLPSTTMSTGPMGGEPVPSMSVAPRMISRSNGPSPSPAGRSGAGWTCASSGPPSKAVRSVAPSAVLARYRNGVFIGGLLKP